MESRHVLVTQKRFWEIHVYDEIDTYSFNPLYHGKRKQNITWLSLATVTRRDSHSLGLGCCGVKCHQTSITSIVFLEWLSVIVMSKKRALCSYLFDSVTRYFFGSLRSALWRVSAFTDFVVVSTLVSFSLFLVTLGIAFLKYFLEIQE